ncbi:MAG: NAD-dependent epimerase/dehydratase family protein [Chlamydiales bacterium]
MTKKIFITGAAGFIGFHAARYLKLRGDHIIGLDNFNDYYSVQLKRDRAQELAKLGVEVIEGDIQNLDDLTNAVEAHQTTHLLHLAAQAGVRYSLQNPTSYLKSNVDGFLTILEICRKHPSIKLTYASSSSVYGLNKKMPYSIEDRTDQQASLYGVTKKANELMAQTYHHLFGVAATGLRFFTVYGPWGRPDMAYYSFTKAILENQPIQLYNQGSMRRDFTYIDDIVEGIAAAIDREMPNALFNLGHHQPEELLHMVALLEKELGRKAHKIMLPMQPGDVVSTYADIKESGLDLHFVPKISLEEGLAHFVRWYRDYV